MEIQSIIREILTQNDFVSLPGIGSFIQKYESAKLSTDGTAIQPPKQTVIFDASRVFNDDAIENYICKITGVSHEKATEQFAAFITFVRDELSKGAEVTFKSVGVLKKDATGVINFKQAPTDEFASFSYGLTSVETGRKVEKTSFEKPKIPTPKPPEHKKVKKLKTSSIVGISLIGVLVLVVIVFALIPEIRFWQNPPVQDEQIIAKTEEKTIIEDAPDTEQQQKVDNIVNQTIESKTEKKAALYYEEPKIQDNRTFYIIAGSFGVIENAQKLSEMFNQKGFSTEIIQGESMYRVSIYKTTDRNTALNELTKLRNDKPNEKFWLLGL